ncbi:hypothetical protein AYM93_05795 [Coxiella burnetii]|uniref:DUF762 family protein n=1 Tax=Coxiella burnetii TaxID=777 RepID=UPI000C03D111|nr:DUF762 family protein [Coxiella burnetii]ATN78355.1 hypothetical protein AYM93_05795 [Coxiella burnetii]
MTTTFFKLSPKIDYQDRVENPRFTNSQDEEQTLQEWTRGTTFNKPETANVFIASKSKEKTAILADPKRSNRDLPLPKENIDDSIKYVKNEFKKHGLVDKNISDYILKKGCLNGYVSLESEALRALLKVNPNNEENENDNINLNIRLGQSTYFVEGKTKVIYTQRFKIVIIGLDSNIKDIFPVEVKSTIVSKGDKIIHTCDKVTVEAEDAQKELFKSVFGMELHETIERKIKRILTALYSKLARIFNFFSPKKFFEPNTDEQSGKKRRLPGFKIK